MYENMTFENILNDMLSRVPNDIDKREGSVIYDALAPSAWKLAEAYRALDINNDLCFADTSSGEFLERRTSEFGVDRKQATFAVRKGLFFNGENELMDIPLLSRFGIEGLVYVAVKKIDTGIYEMTCETKGMIGNRYFGDMLPISFVERLAKATVSEILIPGEEIEEDDVLYKRFIRVINSQPYGGNRADYYEKISSIEGVGAVKLFRTPNGGGTVGVMILDSEFNIPSTTLVDRVQTIMDPTINQGEGLGLAPIGHTVAISAANSKDIHLETTLTFSNGTVASQIQSTIEETFSQYLLSLREQWEDEWNLIVRINQLESRILLIPGIVDVADTKLNGINGNIFMDANEVPLVGEVILHE